MTGERQASRAAIRAATAHIRATCGAVTVPSAAEARRDYSAGRALPKVIALAVIAVVLAVIACSCAFVPPEAVRDVSFHNSRAAAILAGRHPDDMYAAQLLTGTAVIRRYLGEPDTLPAEEDFDADAKAAEEETSLGVWMAVAGGGVALLGIAGRAAGIPLPILDAVTGMALAFLRKKGAANGPKS